jgi:uncharacterized protein (DUF885 family)
MNTTIADLKGLPLDEFFDKSFKQLLLRDPQKITKLGIADEIGLRNDQLTNLSDAYIRETQELQTDILALLRKYDREVLPFEQQISCMVYGWYLDDLVCGHTFMYYDYLVHHFLGGYHHELVQFLTEIHPVTDREGAKDYVSRLSQVGTQVDQVIDGLKRRKKAGVVLPKCIIEMTIDRMDRYIHNDGKLSVYTVFEEKVKKIDIPEKEKQALLEAAAAQIEKSFIPGYRRLLACLESLKAIATDDVGVWKFPKGDEYYKYVLRKETSTDLAPDEIHALGLQEVKRIQKEMRAIFDVLGYPEERLDTLIDRAAAECDTYDISTESGEDHYIERIETILDDITEKLRTVIGIAPQAELMLFKDLRGGLNFYVSGSLDGLRPGVFHVGMGGDTASEFALRTVVYHEAIPGHHFQVAIAQELDLPLFRNVVGFNGYGEGWAMYAEQLPYELDVYADDVYGNIGRLVLELLRAVRLVVDTGIHAKKWTREKAMEYMSEVFSRPSAVEVDRYIVLPGQATGYKVGMVKLLALRQKVMDALGDQFDIKEFHNVVLGNGSMPLQILEKVVQDYIDGKRGN